MLGFLFLFALLSHLFFHSIEFSTLLIHPVVKVTVLPFFENLINHFTSVTPFSIKIIAFLEIFSSFTGMLFCKAYISVSDTLLSAYIAQKKSKTL